jgi:hypothetical protein
LIIDPNYVPSNMLLKRRELGTTRTHPPLTRLQSRLQALEEMAGQLMNEKTMLEIKA